MKNRQEIDDSLHQIQQGLDISAQAQANLACSNESSNRYPVVGRIKKIGGAAMRHSEAFDNWFTELVEGPQQIDNQILEPSTRKNMTLAEINKLTSKGESVIIYPFK